VARTAAPRSRAEWEGARDAIDRAIDIVPDDAAFHDARGDVYVVAAALPWTSMEQAQAHYLEAIKSYRQALAWRPSEPQTWASLAVAYYGAKQWGAPLQQAWARAHALGPHEGHVQPMLLDLVLATWAQATPEMQQWVQDTFERATPSSRIAINKMAAQRGLQFSIAEQPAAGPASAQQFAPAVSDSAPGPR
jgi:tetratricopeptide (TPR) repeat protein